eukprot:TRINITY_DN3146_c0_g1_i11.p1 TRINITY_DN3146_c0_g1~~TRINITY_DN3146_c0_g1_i11.p1  ORF type:complete len:680 (+),score=196.51 TRINITY_DN3146_c0_g1_i11:294-2042(+)
MSRDEKEDFRKFRYYCTDCLLDVGGVLEGEATLAQAVAAFVREMEIFQASQEPVEQKWQGVESALYCIRSIGRLVRTDENVHMPQVMTLIYQVPDHPLARYTALLIVGRYASWINNNVQYLPQLLGFVVDGLNHPDLQGAAALALRHLCEGCAPQLVQMPEYVTSLFDLYSKTSNLDAQDQLEIVEGMCVLVSALPPADLPAALEQLVLPIATSMAHILANHQPAELLSEDKLQAGRLSFSIRSCLDRLSKIFETVDVDAAAHQTHPMLIALQRIWEIVQQFFVKYKNDEKIVEQLTRALKFVVRKTKRGFVALLPPLLTTIVSVFAEAPHSYLLYLVGVCVEETAQQASAEVLGLLLETLQHLTQASFAILKDPDSFVNNPDIADDYFGMVARYISSCPALVIQSNLAPAVLACGLHGLTVGHRQAFVSVFKAIRYLLCAGLPPAQQKEILREGADSEESDREPVVVPVASIEEMTHFQQIVAQHGQTLVNTIIAAILCLPSSRMVYIKRLFDILLHLSPEALRHWLQQALQLPVLPDISDQEKHALYTALTEPDGKRKGMEALRNFSEACRKRLRAQERA